MTRRLLIPFALLICSTSATAAPPGAVVLRAPAQGDVINTNTIIFTWRAADDASGYLLFVANLHGAVIEEYLSSAQTNCAGVDHPALPDAQGIISRLPVSCSYAMSRGFMPGEVRWSIRPFNTDGFGPYSATTTFYVHDQRGAWSVKLPSGSRFLRVLGGSGVLDRETDLIWEQTPSNRSHSAWADASHACAGRVHDQRGGWRLPSVEELLALVSNDPAYARHFQLQDVADPDVVTYWTATPSPDRRKKLTGFIGHWFQQMEVLIRDPSDSIVWPQFDGDSEFYRVDLRGSNGFVLHRGNSDLTYRLAWCVRGGRVDNGF